MSIPQRSLQRLRASPLSTVRPHLRAAPHPRTAAIPPTLAHHPQPPPHLAPLAAARAIAHPRTNYTAPGPIEYDPIERARQILKHRLDHLLGNTAWRVTCNRQGIERLYEFPSAGDASTFCNGVVDHAMHMGHDPEWSGCGRRVYVSWTSHRARGLTLRDADGADACDSLAAKLGGVSPPTKAGAGAGAGAAADDAEEAWDDWEAPPPRPLLLPEWKMEPDVKREIPGLHWAATQQLGLWEWVSAKVEEDSKGDEFRAWSMVFGMACVTQTRFKETADGKMADVGVESLTEEEIASLEMVAQTTDPHEHRSGLTLDLIEYALRG